MKTIKCKVKSKEYEVIIDRNAPFRLSEFNFNRAFVITDNKVDKLYADFIDNLFLKINKSFIKIVIKNGEKSKNLKTVSNIYDALNLNDITKSDIIIAFGGGVIGDIAGFVAATYLRGIRIIQIPTTLLAMVDSSIGGKCGVDMPYGKNLVGSIYQPEAVLINPDFLKTLSKRQFKGGISEVIKCGLTGNYEILEELEKKAYNIERIIYLTALYKCTIVAKDELESNTRMILNFGHTLGHSIELLGNYSSFTHGEAVAIGMVYALTLSEKLKGLNGNIKERTIKLLNKFNLPINCPYNLADMVESAKKDKKMRGDKINFVLLEDLNKPVVETLDLSSINELLGE